MTPLRFIAASLRHYRRIHVAVALGVAVAAAVLTGALLVGDSVRGSLRDLTLQRLGRIDSALVAGHMFGAALADELAADARFQRHFSAAEPAMLSMGTLQSGTGDNVRRATTVSVIGCRPSFWALGRGGPEKSIDGNEVALTDPLARELEVVAGEEILLRIPVSGAIPADSPLGEKSDTSLTRRLQVAVVLPADGLARFALAPSQHAPRNAFVPLETLQEVIDQVGKANAILVATNQLDRASGKDAQRTLVHALHPSLDDYGLHVENITTPGEFLQISSDQLVLPDEVARAAERAFADSAVQPAVTYLANTLAVGSGEAQRKIPYSTITGVDSNAELGPLLDEAGEPIRLGDDEIALNRWAADDLRANVGDTITVTYYEPESTHGRLREHEPAPSFKLRAIVELKTADGQPTRAADPKLTPELPGVTDQASINDWDLPFELVETIRAQDDEYWDEYGTTPKAFVSLATAKRLWASRWGTISLMRIPISGPARTGEMIGNQLLGALNPESLGMSFLPVKQQGLAAASGTTPFDFLFLGFSFFLMAAAVMLIALLFQLGVEQRGRELGTLAAVGVGRRRITWVLGREGLVVAAIGAAIGIAAGVLYAWLMITGLRTWWVDAIGTPFLKLHVTPRSLFIGWTISVMIAWIAIYGSIRRLVRRPVGRLLAGLTAGDQLSFDTSHKGSRTWPIIRIGIVVSIIAASMIGFTLQGEAQAGAFFASGAAVLVLLLGEVRDRWQQAERSPRAIRSFSLRRVSCKTSRATPVAAH